MHAYLIVAQAAPETGLRIDWTTMPTYNTVMAVAAGAGLIMLVLFARELLRSPSDVLPESWALAFGVVGVILTATGLHMTLTWPPVDGALGRRLVMGARRSGIPALRRDELLHAYRTHRQHDVRRRAP
ncbi:MAG TPA: DUF981 family protein [Gemmatimonadota bacterium]|nr:DUF981 family protein [Gemmatimonadota bacterium]